MNIAFAPMDEAYIRSKVGSGYYSNATELVRDAVRRMREQDEQPLRLLAALQVGLADVAAGRTAPVDGERLARLRQQGFAKAAQGQIVNRPDVASDGI